MITAGREWQARQLADAADATGDTFPANDAADRAYCAGVADTLRVIVGDESPDRIERFRAIYARYLSSED